MKKYVFLLLLVSCHSFACSCIELSAVDLVNSSDYVYVGQVIESRIISENVVSHKLRISQTIKGTVDIGVLESGIPDLARGCSQIVATGYKYLVFGNTGKIPKVTFCGKSRLIQNDNNELLAEVRRIANKAM